MLLLGATLQFFSQVEARIDCADTVGVTADIDQLNLRPGDTEANRQFRAKTPEFKEIPQGIQDKVMLFVCAVVTYRLA